MSLDERHSHRPLTNTKHIRLLKLLQEPLLADANNYIECILTEVSLENLPDYFAVSYAWESQSTTRSVFCEGKSLFLTANCAAALSHFHSQGINTFLWVDSICIDQTSNPERNQQVAIMGEIYEKAAGVIIWLGEGNHNSDSAMQVLGKLAKLAPTHPELVRLEYQKLQHSLYQKYSPAYSTEGVSRTLLFPESLTGLCDPTNAITGQSWFHRIWTL